MCFQHTTASAFRNFHPFILYSVRYNSSSPPASSYHTTQIASRLFHPASTRSLSSERPTGDDTSTNTGSGSRMPWDNDDIDILVQCWAEVQRRHIAIPRNKMSEGMRYGDNVRYRRRGKTYFTSYSKH